MALRILMVACLAALVGCTPAPNDDGSGGSGGAPATDGRVPDAAPDVAPEPEPDAAPEPEPDAAPDPDAAPEPEPDAVPEPEPDMAPEPEPDMAPEPEPDMAPEPEPDMGPPPPVCEDDDFEDDDRPIDAVVLDGLANTPVGEGQTVDRRLCGGDDDVYAVDGCANGRLEAELRFTHAEGDLTLAIVDLFGAVLASGESDTDDELAAVDLVDGAPVFVRVSGGAGVETGYTLRLVRTCPECIIDEDCGREALCEGIECVPGECRDDGDCPDRVCVDRQCVRCGDDADCPGGVCSNAICIGCREDADCAAGVCEGAICVQCRADDDCRAGVCVDAVCVGCGDDADCPGGVCVDDSCTECRVDGDCDGGVCADGACVQCRADGDCPGGVCDGAVCVQCRDDGQCPGGVCSDSRCVECAADGDCGDGVCVANGCVECRDAGQCPGGVCDANRCVQCAADRDCADGVCVGNGCVECRGDGDCADGVCAANVCVGCRADVDCGGGVCVEQRCVECAADGDCGGGVCEDQQCVQCRFDGNCPAGVCQGNVCVGCANDGHCPAGACVDQVCVDCREDRDCAEGVCADNACVQCAADADCPDGVCDANVCVGCRADGDCAGGVCEAQQCVQCRADGDCPLGVCTENNRCVQCTDDADCPDGVCVVNACVECRGAGECLQGQICDGGECVEVACADPIVIAPGVELVVVTEGQSDDLQGSCGGGSPDVPLLFVAPAAGQWCVSAEGSDYDTLIYGYVGGCGREEIGCNDDSDAPDLGLQSAFTFEAVADGRYLIIIDGYSNAASTNAGTARVRITPGDCAEPGPRGPQPGELVITELMPDPVAVTDANGEWFELYNNTGDTLDLEGVQFAEEDGGNAWVVEGTLLVEPRGYLVVGKNPDPATNGGVELDYAYGGAMALGNAADDVLITNVEGQLVDAVYYDGGVLWPDPTGASMQLGGDPGLGNNNDPARWCVSAQPYGAGDLGSPGLPNPPCP